MKFTIRPYEEIDFEVVTAIWFTGWVSSAIGCHSRPPCGLNCGSACHVKLLADGLSMLRRPILPLCAFLHFKRTGSNNSTWLQACKVVVSVSSF